VRHFFSSLQICPFHLPPNGARAVAAKLAKAKKAAASATMVHDASGFAPAKDDGTEDTVALAVYRRDAAKNRYVDKEKFGVFYRLPLQAGEETHVSAEGMEGSTEWHRAPGKGAPRYEGEPDDVKGERAILIQSESHIAALTEEFPELRESFAAPGAFGENILARGDLFDSKRVHLGDVFGVEGSKLLLQATSSRRPCANVDIRHGKMYGNAGVRAFCARTGYAGSFFRVLAEGALPHDAKLTLKFRQGPGRLGADWSLQRLSEELYTEANASYHVTCWRGRRVDLRALCAEHGLAEVEWKEVLRELLGRELTADGGCRALRIVSGVVWVALVCYSWRFAPPIRKDWVEW